MNFLKGEVFGINKPYGITSFKAVAHTRYHIKKRLDLKKMKIGHAGTLDPLASGVLIMCTGKATKQIEKIQQNEKEYITEMQLGATTPSYDMEQDVDKIFETSHIIRSLIDDKIKQFIGNIQQVPPQYSACKIDGKRAYDLMRKGKSVELTPKNVFIKDIEVINFDEVSMKLQLKIICGKGTYIRSLARDLGQSLDSGAYLTKLERTRIGDINIENCINLNDFETWLDEQTIETDKE